MAMADIVLNVEIRERSGKGAARSVRKEDKVPGVLYGGPLGPVSLAVKSGDFKKALYTGKLLGHLVTLKYGKETQPVIAKDVQFHPVSDEPVHFDLYRVEENQRIRISVPVHFSHQDESPGIKRGGALNIVRHDIEVWAPATAIPEELVADLTGLEIGDTVRIGAIALPEGVESAVADPDFVIATITGASALEVEEPTAEEGEEGEAAAAEPEAAEEE
jgi:large subunit ribosomal protein L25